MTDAGSMPLLAARQGVEIRSYPKPFYGSPNVAITTDAIRDHGHDRASITIEALEELVAEAKVRAHAGGLENTDGGRL